MSRQKMLYVLGFCLLLALPVFAFTFLDIAPFSSVETSARAINDANDVVGDFATAADQLAFKERGYLLHAGKFSVVNVPDSFDTDANGINNLGTIVGTYAAKNLDGTQGLDHGYIKNKTGYHTLADPPAGLTFPDFNAINDENDIVGVVSTNAGNRGFLLDDGVYTPLDCGGSDTEANGINANEDIVGQCRDSVLGVRAFLLHNGVYHTFDAPGAVNGTIAYGINAFGDISGTYRDANFLDHGFVVEHLLGTRIWKTVNHPGATVMETTVFGINKQGHLAGTVTFTTNTTNVEKGFRAQ
ncbi:MAG TPA: hypothetical protein VHF01_19045 [Candidatus Acidoferrum sp.]|nr:hypothetical protein [Candidatus Acidoferrum sp.]